MNSPTAHLQYIARSSASICWAYLIGQQDRFVMHVVNLVEPAVEPSVPCFLESMVSLDTIEPDLIAISLRHNSLGRCCTWKENYSGWPFFFDETE